MAGTSSLRNSTISSISRISISRGWHAFMIANDTCTVHHSHCLIPESVVILGCLSASHHRVSRIEYVTLPSSWGRHARRRRVRMQAFKVRGLPAPV